MTLQRFNAVCFRGSFSDFDVVVDAECRNSYWHDLSTVSAVRTLYPSEDLLSGATQDNQFYVEATDDLMSNVHLMDVHETPTKRVSDKSLLNKSAAVYPCAFATSSESA